MVGKNKIVKAMLTLSLTLLGVLALAVTSFAEGEVAKVYNADGSVAASFATVEEAMGAVPAGGKVELLADTTLTGTTKSADGYAYPVTTSFTLTGGADKHTLTLTGTDAEHKKSFIDIQNATLTLENITLLGDTDVYNGNSAGFTPYGLLCVQTNGNVILDSGTTISKVGGRNGAAIFLNGNGKAEMRDGALVEKCKTTYSKGAIYIIGGECTFTMNGGTIRYNEDATVTAIHATAGNIVLNGGEITANGTAQKPAKGAVYLKGEVSLTFNGTRIYDNFGANVYISDKDKTTVKGELSNNTCSDNIVAGARIYYDADDEAAINVAVSSANNTWMFYTKLKEALDSAAENAEVVLLKDVSFISEDIIQNGAPRVGYIYRIKKNVIINGDGKKLIFEDKTSGAERGSSGLQIEGKGNVTLKNLTLERKATAPGKYPVLWVIGKDAVLNTENITVTCNSSNEAYNGTVMSLVDGATANLNSGTKITGCSSNNSPAIWVFNGSLNLDGAIVTDNALSAVYMTAGTLNVKDSVIKNSWKGIIVRKKTISANAKITISGATEITGNARSGKAANVELYIQDGDACSLNIAQDFTGRFGISGTPLATAGAEFATEGNVIATCEEGYTLPGADSVTCDNSELFAYIDGTSLKLTKKPQLKIETDKGKYKTGEKSYGVIRVLTASENDAETPVEYFGTAFIMTDGAEVLETTPKRQFSEGDEGVSAIFGAGKGFIVDMDEAEAGSITLDENTTYAYIPVSFYKIKGINAVQYVYGSKVSFTKANEKTVEYTD